jgi:hypothetical protein
VNSVVWRAVIDRPATARVQRLIRWLEPFQRCFGHRAQRLALRTYVHGVFSNSDRQSMQAMLARHAAGHLPSLSAFHHARGLGRRPDLATSSRGVLPERRGVFIIDGTRFP